MPFDAVSCHSTSLSSIKVNALSLVLNFTIDKKVRNTVKSGLFVVRMAGFIVASICKGRDKASFSLRTETQSQAKQ